MKMKNDNRIFIIALDADCSNDEVKAILESIKRKKGVISLAPVGEVRAQRHDTPSPARATLAPMTGPGPALKDLVLEDLRELIIVHGGRIAHSRRRIAAHLSAQTDRDIKPSTFCEWVADWIAEKKIVEIEEGSRFALALPGAATPRRQMVSA